MSSKLGLKKLVAYMRRLVDRIVPGFPRKDIAAIKEKTAIR